MIQKVEQLQGCKATELAAIPEIAMNVEDFPTVLQQLIDEHSIVEVEYTVPEIPYRLKSFLLPKNSQVTKIT